jgi:integrase
LSPPSQRAPWTRFNCGIWVQGSLGGWWVKGDLHTIQRWMGHRHLTTTARYLQLARHTHTEPGSPLDLLDPVDAPAW